MMDWLATLTRLYEVLRAVADDEIPLRVDGRNVARHQPPIIEFTFLLFCRQVVILARDPWASYKELALCLAVLREFN